MLSDFAVCETPGQFLTHGAGYCFLTRSSARSDAGFFSRQATEQYFTSLQFFAQRFRHVISRPQARQTLLGSEDLFPLNPTTHAQPSVL